MPERLSDCYLRRGLEPLDGVVLGVVPRDGIEPPTRGFSNNCSAKYVNKNNNINLLKLGMLLSMLYQCLN